MGTYTESDKRPVKKLRSGHARLPRIISGGYNLKYRVNAQFCLLSPDIKPKGDTMDAIQLVYTSPDKPTMKIIIST